MAIGLTRPQDLPEPVREELTQLITALQGFLSRAHDAQGLQKRVWGRWRCMTDPSLTTGVPTRVVVSAPHARTAAGSLSVSTTGQITIHESGLYLIHGSVAFDTGAAGRRAGFLYLNGVRIAYASDYAAANVAVQPSLTMLLVPGDVIELYALQDSGGALTVFGVTGGDTWLSIAQVA